MGGAGEGCLLGAEEVKPIDEVTFLRKLQRLLEEGDFVATYKFALLQALADLSVENEPASNGTLALPLSLVAEKFIEGASGESDRLPNGYCSHAYKKTHDRTPRIISEGRKRKARSRALQLTVRSID